MKKTKNYYLVRVVFINTFILVNAFIVILAADSVTIKASTVTPIVFINDEFATTPIRVKNPLMTPQTRSMIS
jgi:hypothetical protein